MAGFTDLVMRAQPRLADINIDITEGRTFRFEIDEITDGADAAIDLTAATFVCKVLTDVDGTEVVALDVAGGLGSLSITKAGSGMVGLAAGATRSQPRVCCWYLKVTSGANVVQFWGPSESIFTIYGE